MCTPPEKKEVPPLSKQDSATISEDEAKIARKQIADTLIKTVRSYEDTAKILTAGQFHEDEVWPGAEKENWLGLFRGEAGFFLANPAVVISRIKDDLLDMEGDTTGWLVSTENLQEPLILIAGLTFLKEGMVEEIELPKQEIFPGDTVKFNMNGNRYSLHAIGVKTRAEYNPDEYEVSGYKLYLTTTTGRESFSQLLVSHSGFDGAMVTLLFAGDIDDDDLPDLILNTSNHYNVSNPTLFLSRPAKQGSVLKVMGQHRTVGC